MNSHEERIKNELKSAGVTWFGMQKFAVKHIPKIIEENEHIKGIVYGRYAEKNSPGLSEGALIATDLRIVFLDHKPGFTKTDELTYDVVSGVNLTKAVSSAVTLHTRIGDFTIRFANSKCAAIFVRYVEERRIEKPMDK